MAILRRTFVFLSALFFLCLSSCGVEVYYSLEAPLSRAMANPIDASGRFFSFYTNESGALSVFKGTNVYYKIYNNMSELNSDINSINASNAEYSSSGYNRIASLGYQQLETTARPDILFPDAGSDREIIIRLIDEGMYTAATDTFAYTAQVRVAGAIGPRPLRRSSGEGFNFYLGRGAASGAGDPNPNKPHTPATPNDPDKLPASGDLDTRYSSSPTSANTWYVNAYAVSVGQDPYLTLLYSQLLHLGHIVISQ
jgi:hypothetical protein